MINLINSRRNELILMEIERKELVQLMKSLVVSSYPYELFLRPVAKVNAKDWSYRILFALTNEFQAAGCAVDVRQRQCFDAVIYGPLHEVFNGHESVFEAEVRMDVEHVTFFCLPIAEGALP